MRRRTLCIIIFSFVFSSVRVSAQDQMFLMEKFSKFAKVIRLGSAYTGYAEGLESISTNTAGLANSNQIGLIFSDAYGVPLTIPKNSIYNISLAVPSSFYDIVFAASYDRLSLSLSDNQDYIDSKISFHAARKLSQTTSIGLSVNYFRHDSKSTYSTFDSPLGIKTLELTADVFDLSFGFLHKVSDPFDLYVPNKLGFGIYIENLLSTKVKYNSPIEIGNNEPQDKFQEIRVGTSYEIASDKIRLADLNFIKMLFVFDAVFTGSNYSFELFQPNYGIEFTFFEVLSFSYGRENEIELNDVYGGTLAHPVSRYGIGISLPLHKLFNINKHVTAEINYCKTNLDKKGLSTGYKMPDDTGMSVSLNWGL